MKPIKNIKDYYIIKKSRLFDENWFIQQYDVPEGHNPIKYYLKYGIEKHLNPSDEFDTLWYLNEYEDVRLSGIHPFVHYINHGIHEHRLSKPLFYKNQDKFLLINQDYNPCFFKNSESKVDSNEVNIGIFIKNDVDNLLPTEYIRLIIPFYHLFLKKRFTPFILHDYDVHNVDFENFDIIIVQRDAIDEKTAEFLVGICKQNNIKLIYEIDDNLLEIDENHPNFLEFNEKRSAVEFLISNSDIVCVSTDKLKDEFYSINKNIKVIKNSLNDMLNLKNNNYHSSDTIKIGYMGTVTHKNDVKIIEKAIDNVKRYFSEKDKNVVFETIGISDEKISYANQINIPFKYSRYPYFIQWLKRIVDWDIAIAPLENTSINSSKSEIKYLEYSSLGIPGIYSDIGLYSDVIENNKNGILVFENSVNEWQSAIINLIENEDLRKKIVKNAVDDIKNDYSVESMVDSWCELLEDLLTKEKRLYFNKNPLKLLTNPTFNREFDIIEKSDFSNGIKNEDYSDEIYDYLTNGVFNGVELLKGFNSKEYAKKNNIGIVDVNPFVHFLSHHVNKLSHNYLNYESISDILDNLNRPVSMIIPIYNAFEETKRCIESVLKYSSINYELILINDNSTDERIMELLNSIENPYVKVINNDDNKGFVANVNLGFENSEYDVILLNSDTIVTPNWIEKLIIAAYSNKKIATVTPVSNNAGVFSVPKMNVNNLISEKLGLNGMAKLVEKASHHVYLRVPTGNGFCMHIKREAINIVGNFDEETFGRGYCEENDFCMRAIEKGWENIIDESTYIFHSGSSSFGLDKQNAISRNMELLCNKHPTYTQEVARFVNSNKFKNIGLNVEDALKNNGNSKKTVLHISDSKDSLLDNNNENYLLFIGDIISLYYMNGNYLFKLKDFLRKDIDEICFNIIINLGINELSVERDDLNLTNSKILMDLLN